MYNACLQHSRADRVLRLVVAKRLEQFGVTMMEWLLIGVVRNGPKDGMTMTEVAVALDVTLPQVTALTANLIKQKLLKQKVSRQDRRSRSMTITKFGTKTFDAISADVDTVLTDWISSVSKERFSDYLAVIDFLAGQKPAVEN